MGGKLFTTNFKRRIDYWANRIELLKKRIDPNGCNLFKEAQFQHLRAIEHQSDFWKQRVKEFWLKDGDRNTTFFHNSVWRRRSNNQIARLKKHDGSWAERGFKSASVQDKRPTCTPKKPMQTKDQELRALVGGMKFGSLKCHPGTNLQPAVQRRSRKPRSDRNPLAFTRTGRLFSDDQKKLTTLSDCKISDQPVPQEHKDQDGDASGGMNLALNVIPDELTTGGATASATQNRRNPSAFTVLDVDQEAVAVKRGGDVLDPRQARRHSVHVESAGEDKRQHGNSGDSGGLFGVHNNRAQEQPQALRHHHVSQHDQQRKNKRQDLRFQPRHPVENSDEQGGERVHAGSPLLDEDGALLREREGGVERREDPPEDGDEEEQAEAVLDVGVVGVPPHGAGQEGGRHDLEDPEGVEGVVAALFEASVEENRELHLVRYAHPLSLPAGDSPDEGVADDRVLAFLQPQLGDHRLGRRDFVSLGERTGEPEERAEDEGFADREVRVEDVVLGHEPGSLQNRFAEFPVIGEHCSGETLELEPPCKSI
nr:uncharacterized protein LOC109159588 isoform X2 [Ipomoea batatas]